MISIPIIFLLSLSFLALIPIATPAVVADSTPILTPASGSYEVGTGFTITATWLATVHGDSYTGTLWSSPTDSCLGPQSSWTEVATGFASFSQSGLNTQATFTVPATFTNGPSLFLCAVIVDTTTAANSPPTAGPASFVQVSPLFGWIDNDECGLLAPLNKLSEPIQCISVDLGQNVTLTAYALGGAPPFTYQWYSGTSCSTALKTDASTTEASFTTDAITATTSFSVQITDSSTPPSTWCAYISITPSPDIVATLSVDGAISGELNEQAGSPPLSAVVTWTGGDGPWYSVTVYSGTDSVCFFDTTVLATASDINATSYTASFNAPKTPSTNTYYCATVTDSSVGFVAPANTVYSGVGGPTVYANGAAGISVQLTPALSAPSMFVVSLPYYTTSADYGQSETLLSQVSWSGGVEPYYVILLNGSQSSCTAGGFKPLLSPVVYPGQSTSPGFVSEYGPGYLTPNPLTQYGLSLWTNQGYDVFETTGTLLTVLFPSPPSTSYYCAIVIDSSNPVNSTTYTAAGSEFLIETGIFAANPPTLSSYTTEVLSPQYEGTSVTATVTFSGGSPWFDVTLYNDTAPHDAGNGLLNYPTGACLSTDPIITVTPGSNPVTGLTTDTASFTFLAPNTPGTYYYCAIVTDINGNTAVSGPSKTLTVSTILVKPTLTLNAGTYPGILTAPGTDTGQTEPATATVTWSGGNAPYSVTLYSGTSPSSCSADTTVVGTQSGIFQTTAYFTFTSPSTTTYYCATVSDSSAPTSTGTSVVVPWLDSQPPFVYVSQSSAGPAIPGNTFEISAGSTATLYPVISSAGTPGDFIQWFIGAGCVAGSQVTKILPGFPGPGFPVPHTPYTPPGSQYNTGVISTTTTYSVELTDSSAGTPAASSCATVTVTVYDGPNSVLAVSTGVFAGLVYVTNPDYNSVSVIDTDSNAVTMTIAMPSYTGTPWGLAYYSSKPYSLSGDNWVFVTVAQAAAGGGHAKGYGWLCSINMATGLVMACNPTGGYYPEGVAVSSTLGEIFTANSANDTVGVNTLSWDALPVNVNGGSTNTINVGPGPMNVAVDPTTNNIYVTNNGGDTLSVIQPQTPTIFAVTTVPVGFEPVGVAINPLNDDILVANYGSGTVSVLSGANYMTLATIKTGGEPTGISIDAASNTAYVNDAMNNDVIAINLATNAPSATTIPVGTAPFGSSFFLSPASPAIPSLLIVANSGSNYISVINPATGQVTCTIVVP